MRRMEQVVLCTVCLYFKVYPVWGVIADTKLLILCQCVLISCIINTGYN